MPFVDEFNGFRPPSGVTPAPEVAPASGDTIGAAFQQGNTLVSGLHFLNLPRFAAEDGYNPVDDLKVRRPDLFYSHGDRFTGSTSSKQSDQIISEIEREDANNRTLVASGWAGTIAGLGAGAMDPTMFLPMGAVAKGGLATADALTTARSVAKLALLQSTAQEALLSGTQQTRTLSESAANIGSATILGGMLGAAGHALLAREGLAEKGAADLDVARARLSEHNGVAEPAASAPGVTGEAVPGAAANSNLPPPESAPQSVGAAVADTRDLSPTPYGLDSIPGVGKAVSKIFPNLDVLTNGVDAAKRAVTELAEVPLSLKANVEGQTATRYGGPAIDREIKLVREGLHAQADDVMMQQWSSYLEGQGGQKPGVMQRMTGNAGEGRMTFDAFDAAVYDALSTGDQHPIPQVAAAAQWMRKNGFDPVKERAAAIDGFSETKLREGETYAPRLWNKDKISAQWNDYVGMWTEHLQGEQTRKAQLQSDINVHVAKLTALEERAAKLDGQGSKATVELADVESQIAELRGRVETSLEQWGGKSAKEAMRSIEAREKATMEAERPEGAPRLRSADKAVDRAVKRILGSDRTLDRQELRSRAEEIASRQIGTPDGRLPYDSAETHGEAGPGASELRGHAARREIDLPYDIAKPWLDRSATQALKSYTHSVLPDAIIAERFDGDPAMTSVMKEIESSYAAKRAAAGDSEAAQNKLKAAMDNDIRIVAGMRDRIRGTYANDPQMRSLARLSQNALKINNIISSHGMAVASLPDFAGVVFRNGFEGAFRDAWLPFFNSLIDKEGWQAVKAAGQEWKAFGIGIETQSASRNHALSDINENYRPTSKFERALSWVSDKAFLANLLAPLTDIQKRMATNAVSHNIIRMSQAVAEGKATAKDIQRLAEGNITEAQAAKIWDQFSINGGASVKGILLPNTAGWTDAAAKRAFVGAVARDVDIAVVQPGQEKPFFMSKPGYNVLGQYKAFSFASTQRILIANLQRRDAASLSGLITAVGMGMLSYRINTMASGQPVSERPQDWIKEGISRGGILGVLDDANNFAAKATGGKADLHRLYGADKPLTKFVNRDAASMFLGPTYGKVQSLMQVSRAATNPSTWGESDTHALRMATLGTNFPYLPRLFDQVEIGVNHALGIPMKAKN
jgi:hypothetical protein